MKLLKLTFVTYVVLAGPVQGLAPVVASADGVVNGASFLPGIASGSWFTIRGTDLSATTRTWGPADFQGNRLPVVLDGVSVRVNNRDAYIYYVSPTQINALAPADASTGSVNVTVTNASGTSAPVTAVYQAYSPALFAFEARDRVYPAAVHPDGVPVGPPGLLGFTSRPAYPGGRISLYATGLGATSPTVDPGAVLANPVPLSPAGALRVLVNNVAATIEYAGMVSNGLYQLNIVVPEVQDGEQSLAVEIGGVRSPSLRISILRPILPALNTAGRTLESAQNCFNFCTGTVTVLPGEQTEFWVTGTNMQSISSLRFLPSDGITVSLGQATPTSIVARVTVSSGAPLGKRELVAVSPAGESRTNYGSLNVSTFRIANPRVQNVVKLNGTLTFTALVEYSDPTGAVSSGPLTSVHSIIWITDSFGSAEGIRFLGSLVEPTGRVPGATNGVFTIPETFPRGDTRSAVFRIQLTAADGRLSDEVSVAF